MTSKLENGLFVQIYLIEDQTFQFYYCKLNFRWDPSKIPYPTRYWIRVNLPVFWKLISIEVFWDPAWYGLHRGREKTTFHITWFREGHGTGCVTLAVGLTVIVIAGEEFDIYPLICPCPPDAINSIKENFKLDETFRNSLMVSISNAIN